jgi:hypothetical protein
MAPPFLYLILILIPQFQALQIAPIDSPGYFLETLGNVRIVNHYHSFMFYFNTSQLRDVHSTLYDNLQTSLIVGHLKTGKWDNLTDKLFNTLYGNINKSREILDKLDFKRQKRGLVNGLGTLIKFITGNADNNDVQTINTHLDTLYKTQRSEIVKIDSLTSFANHVSQRLKAETETINKNFKEIKAHLDSLESTNDLRTLLYNEIFESETFLHLLEKLERTISMSLHEIPNLEIINVSELLAMHNHLTKVYSPAQLIPFDETHLFKFIESTKLIILGTNDSISFLLKIPILNPYPSEYLQIFPLPTSEDVILAPPKKYSIKTEDLQLWTDENCKSVNSVTLCEESPTPDPCALPALKNCVFVQLRNDYQIVIPLKNQQLLTAFKNSNEIVEDCDGQLTRHHLIGNNLVSSSCSLIIGPKVFTNTTVLFRIPLPTSVHLSNLSITKTIDFHPRLLESPELIMKEASELQLPITTIDSLHYSMTITTWILVLAALITLFIFRQRIVALLCHPRTIIHVETSKFHTEDRKQESCRDATSLREDELHP